MTEEYTSYDSDDRGFSICTIADYGKGAENCLVIYDLELRGIEYRETAVGITAIAYSEKDEKEIAQVCKFRGLSCTADRMYDVGRYYEEIHAYAKFLRTWYYVDTDNIVASGTYSPNELGLWVRSKTHALRVYCCVLFKSTDPTVYGFHPKFAEHGHGYFSRREAIHKLDRQVRDSFKEPDLNPEWIVRV